MPVDGAEYAGNIGGLDAWRRPGAPALAFLAPDGRTVVIGFAFTGAGRDLTAAFTGGEPQPLAAMFPQTVISGDQKAIANGLGAAASKLDLGEPHLNDLAERLARTSTPEEYQKVLKDWSSELSEKSEPSGGSGSGQIREDEITPGIGFDAAQAPEVNVAAKSETAASGSAATAEGAVSGKSVLERLERDGFWFSVGATEDVPTVYAIVDPECPYCARSIEMLSERIRGGRLQLRVLLTPVLSEASVGRSLAILESDDPAATLLEHGISKAKFGRSEVALPNKGSIPAEAAENLRKILRSNAGLASALGVEAVPFFAWSENNVPRTLMGAPSDAAAFDGADSLPAFSRDAEAVGE
ncbi:hypothetical protein HNS03_18670 [Amorphus sp. 3PC139-8]